MGLLDWEWLTTECENISVDTSKTESKTTTATKTEQNKNCGIAEKCETCMW